jgi:hypothetical protein
MTRLRRALGRIAIAWLLCQAGLLAATPIVLWAGAGEGLLECTCAHGDHTYCPMHHAPKPGSKTCFMQNGDNSGVSVLASIFGFVGMLTASSQVVAPSPASSLVQTAGTASCRPTPPDPPPPRA